MHGLSRLEVEENGGKNLIGSFLSHINMILMMKYDCDDVLFLFPLLPFPLLGASKRIEEWVHLERHFI